jgi:hypothetical protein
MLSRTHPVLPTLATSVARVLGPVLVVARALLPVVIIALASFIVHVTVNRQRLLRFFRIHGNSTGLTIYLSRLQPPAGSSVYEAHEPTEGYAGPAIIRIEHQGAQLITDLLRSATLARIPRGLQEWLRVRRATLVPVQLEIDTSPPTVHQVRTTNLVLMGSGIYNSVSSFYLKSVYSKLTFEIDTDGERVVIIRAQSQTAGVIPGRSLERELGILQRLYDHEQRRHVIICAGTGSSATFGTARYLAENWRQLQRKHGDSDFAICFAFRDQPRDADVVVEPQVMYECSLP